MYQRNEILRTANAAKQHPSFSQSSCGVPISTHLSCTLVGSPCLVRFTAALPATRPLHTGRVALPAMMGAGERALRADVVLSRVPKLGVSAGREQPATLSRRALASPSHLTLTPEPLSSHVHAVERAGGSLRALLLKKPPPPRSFQTPHPAVHITGHSFYY